MDQLTLTLTGKQMDIIANALGMRPYIEVADLLNVISQQIRVQQQPQPALPFGPDVGPAAQVTQ